LYRRYDLELAIWKLYGQRLSWNNLKSITFIIRLMHSVLQNKEVEIYVVQKFKRHKIKNHSDVFRILCDPSSGNKELCSLMMNHIRSETLWSDF